MRSIGAKKITQIIWIMQNIKCPIKLLLSFLIQNRMLPKGRCSLFKLIPPLTGRLSFGGTGKKDLLVLSRKDQGIFEGILHKIDPEEILKAG